MTPARFGSASGPEGKAVCILRPSIARAATLRGMSSPPTISSTSLAPPSAVSPPRMKTLDHPENNVFGRQAASCRPIPSGPGMAWAAGHLT